MIGARRSGNPAAGGTGADAPGGDAGNRVALSCGVIRPLFLLVACCIAAPAAAQRPLLTPADYASWETFGMTEMSPDGRWFAYTITRDAGDDELRIREVARDSTLVVKHATRPVFAPGSRWLAWSIGISETERRTMDPNEPVRSRLGLMDLSTRSITVIDDVADFSFSGDGSSIALRAVLKPDARGRGVDVVVRHLASGMTTRFRDVAEQEWQPGGAWLAMVVDGGNRALNGVTLFDAAARRTRTLARDTSRWTGLSWQRDGNALAVLQAVDGTHVIHAWRDPAGTRTPFRFDSRTTSRFPARYSVVSTRPLRWSDDGARLFLGIRRRAEPAPAANDSMPRANVEVWHSGDVEIVPERKVRAGIDGTRSDLAAWHLASGAFLQIGDSVTEEVTLSRGRFALGVDATPYDSVRRFGPAYRDLWIVDIEGGTRARVAQRVLHHYGLSESGRWLLYVKDGHYWTYDTHTQAHRNITGSIATSFINTTFDFPIPEKPPFGTGGWLKDDAAVLLYDRYDVWEVKPDGSGARNMTNGAADRIRSRRVWLFPEDRVVDLARPVLVSLYGERTKQTGYGRLHASRGMERLAYGDSLFSRIGRAADADVLFYRVERFDDSPDYHVADANLQDAVQVTRTNPFERNFAWGQARLVDFRSTTGRELQGALFLPANYDPARKYPLIVFPYEITSNTLHQYVPPSETVPLNVTVLTQQGYMVLRPDVVFRARDPGVSAMEAILPAIDRVVAMGSVDTARIAIVGHSWGGYQAAFAVTQTDRFAAAVAGAPLANMISMYLSIYWNSGGTDARMFEIDQGRMEVPFWDDLDAYIRNSPVFHVRDMDTPLLVAFGDRDGAVDWHQGIELYNAARRADRQLVMLVYPGENHSLARRENQVDYHRRILQWLGHYLDGGDAAEWMKR